jgi:TolB-like protein/cytochrome c-type biogenesis protein CcmH/NrfG
MSLLSELSRRNVIRVAIAYLAGAWLLIQVLETLFPIFGVPATSIQVIVVILAIGFVPAVIAAWVFQLTPDGLKLDADVDRAAPGASAKILDRIIIVMLTLAVGYFAIDKFVFDPARDAADIEAAREEGRSDAIVGAFGDKSIIVLPFVNMSDDASQEYFSDGLTEELLNLLAKIPELRVVSRSTAFTFKGKENVVPEVAKKVNVAHVLEGSVRKSGNKIRVTAQLIDARTDRHLWSETYDREIDDIFVIQDDISGQVVEELKLRLLGRQPLAARVDPQAYDLFLQALFILNQGDDDDEIRRAESLLLQALRLEPDFPAAISELARAYWKLIQSDPSGPYRQLRDEQIDRLIAIDPDGSDANAWLAMLNTWEDRNPQAAARYMEAAIAADPTNLRTLRIASFFLTELGRTEEAIAVGNYIVSRDPACGSCVSALAIAYRHSGRHAEAVRTMESMLEWRPPDHQFNWHMGVAYLFSGQPGKALELFEPGKDDGMGYAYLLALHELGRYEEFEERLAGEIERIDENGGGVVARIYAWLGENDKAFEYLEMAMAADPNMFSAVGNDFYRKIQSDPRWDELMSRYGIVPWYQLDIEFNPRLPEEILRSIE